MTSSNQAAWYLAQLVAGLKPKCDIDPRGFIGEWAEAYNIYLSGNGRGASALQAWLGQHGHETIRQSVFAHRPGTPAPTAEDGDYKLTDLGNAERLAQQHFTQLRYVREWDWMAFKDGRWQRDPASAVQAAKLTVRRMYGEAERTENDEARKELSRWAFKCESSNRIDAMIKLARNEYRLIGVPSDFDRDPMLLNCANGVLDLSSGKLHPHDHSDMLTHMAGSIYDPKATCPNWLRFLDRIFEGNKELIAFIQRALGYSLTGDTSEQCLFFLHGSGRNGKSTLLEIVRAMLGTYSQQAEPTTFMARANDTGLRNDIARMVGVRFVAAIEIGDGKRLNETLIKSVTGQDTIAARFLHREFFEFAPQFKLWMAANHKPIIRGTDEGIWRRIRLIPFDVIIPIRDVDRQLKAKLLKELPGIMAWAVRGCLDWQKSGMKAPEAVVTATKEYRAEMDVMAAFINECCIIQNEARVSAGDLYRAYKHWCEVNGEYIDNQRAFGMRMNERSFERDRSNGTFIYRGLGLVSERESDE